MLVKTFLWLDNLARVALRAVVANEDFGKSSVPVLQLLRVELQVSSFVTSCARVFLDIFGAASKSTARTKKTTLPPTTQSKRPGGMREAIK